jgi:two-component system CheB/CheR fusion protein
LLEYLRFRHNFDFSGYKRSSLIRSAQVRLDEIGIEGYNNYREYLEAHPEEFTRLFNTIEINFSCFFRDILTWDYLKAAIIPRIIAAKSPSEPIRVWSAGCSTGEEVCTLAMLLAEALGIEKFQKRVKIFATDVDSEAILQARSGIYASHKVQDIRPDLLNKYFEQTLQGYIFCPDLRRSIIWNRHNIIEDAPMSKIDLLVCRNTMIYFNPEAKKKALARFYFSLADKGILFLGKADGIPNDIDFFPAISLPQHIFTKAPKTKINQRLLHRNLLRDTVQLAR